MIDFDTEPTAADLATVEVPTDDLDDAEFWNSLIDEIFEVAAESDDEDDEPEFDDRYSGDGIPSWSAWA